MRLRAGDPRRLPVTRPSRPCARHQRGRDARVTAEHMRRLILILVACVGAVAGGGCDRDDMHNGARLKPYEASDFFADGSSARPQVEGTVARHQAVDPTIAGSGRVNGQLVDAFPFEITREALVRGQQRYVIYCTPCHAATGEGDGMIVRRGFTRPPSFHSQKLREAPVGHFVDVMTNGYGAMYSYADRVSVRSEEHTSELPVTL